MPNHLATAELLEPHRHAGRDYKPGQFIRLAGHKAGWGRLLMPITWSVRPKWGG